MSERIRRSHLKHTFEAKHVIVAGCAAIAMVLGAMSVGSGSLSSHNDTSSEISSIVSTAPAPATSSTLGGTGLTRQHTLEVRNFLQQQSSPLYTPPAPAKANRKALSPIFDISGTVKLKDPLVQLPVQSPSNDPLDSNTQPATTSSGTTASPTTSTDTATPTPTEDPNDPGTNPDMPDEADSTPTPTTTTTSFDEPAAQ